MANVTEVIPADQWAGRVKRSKSEQLHDLFAFQWRARRLPPFVTELQFAKAALGRRWQFDFACEPYMLAVEIEGLVFKRIVDIERKVHNVVVGRHANIAGFKEDAIKYASAAVLGWTVLRFEQSQVRDGTAIEYAQRVLYARGWQR